MHHSIHNLTYRLLCGEPDFAPLRILVSRVSWWKGWRVEFRVLAASHCLTLTREQTVVSELLACAALPDSPLPLVTFPANTPRETHFTADDLTLHITLHPFDLLTEACADLHGEFAPEEQITTPFPAASTSRFAPLTRIGWQIRSDALRIETLHTYPEEGRGVRTFTQIETHPLIMQEPTASALVENRR